ncbi:hypothetical protein PG996_003037 [Apiospora saccharicola]|uniref:Uncharacterized protein n=1 Tax=Apiospora saccharicola TaxID=335842 RepID=A0ABR1W1D6_9PEZI
MPMEEDSAPPSKPFRAINKQPRPAFAKSISRGRIESYLGDPINPVVLQPEANRQARVEREVTAALAKLNGTSAKS